MANCAYTKIHFRKEDKKKIMEAVKSDEWEFDFNKVIKIPEGFRGLLWWGTNSWPFDIVWGEDYVTFWTKWSHPFQVLEELFNGILHIPAFVEMAEEQQSVYGWELLLDGKGKTHKQCYNGDKFHTTRLYLLVSDSDYFNHQCYTHKEYGGIDYVGNGICEQELDEYEAIDISNYLNYQSDLKREWEKIKGEKE